MAKLVNDDVFYISDKKSKKETYIKSNKEGFWVVWEITKKETKDSFKEYLNLDVNRIKCHLSIWNKIFYEKHKVLWGWLIIKKIFY